MDRQAEGYSSGSRAYLDQLSVNLSAPCEDYPYQGMDESYELKVRDITPPSI